MTSKFVVVSASSTYNIHSLSYWKLESSTVWNKQIDYYTNFRHKNQIWMLCTAVFGIMNNYSAIVVDRNSCCLFVCWIGGDGEICISSSHITKKHNFQTAPHFQLDDWISSSSSLPSFFVFFPPDKIFWIFFHIRFETAFRSCSFICMRLWLWFGIVYACGIVCTCIVVSKKKCISVTKSNTTSQLIRRYC